MFVDRPQRIRSQATEPELVETVEITGIGASVRFNDDLWLAVSADPAGSHKSLRDQLEKIVKQLDASVISCGEIPVPEIKKIRIKVKKAFRSQGICGSSGRSEISKAWGKLHISQVQLFDLCPDLCGMSRRLFCQGAEHVMFDEIFLQQGNRMKNLLIRSLPRCVDPDRVVAFRENIQRDSDEKPVFGKKTAPVIIQKNSVCLKSIVYMDIPLFPRNILYQIPLKVKSRKHRFTALK